MTSKPSSPRNPDTGHLAVPGSAALVARLGGTAALLAAAAISASTLYRLGLRVGLVPATAWMFPAALDIYAASAIFTGYRISPDNPASTSALLNARVALALTIGCNALEHVLTLAGTVVSPAVRNGLLVAVASLPPLIVERLLHLQTLLVRGPLANGDHGGPASATADSAVDGVQKHSVSLTGREGGTVQSELVLATTSCNEAAFHTGPAVHERPAEQWAGAVTDDASSANCVPHAHERPHQIRVAVRSLEPAVLAELAAPIYRNIADRSGRRPGERVFHQALTDHIAALADGGKIPHNVRMPSLSTAKRVRVLIESVQTVTDRPEGR